MDDGDDWGHEFVGEVHDDGVVEETETPSPLVVHARGEIDEKGGGEQERKIEEREKAGESGCVDEAKPSDKEEELEDVFVGEEVEEVASGQSREASGRG